MLNKIVPAYDRLKSALRSEQNFHQDLLCHTAMLRFDTIIKKDTIQF